MVGLDVSRNKKNISFSCRKTVTILQMTGRSFVTRPVFLNRRAAARYRALASIIPGRERFSWTLSF